LLMAISMVMTLASKSLKNVDKQCVDSHSNTCGMKA